MPKESFKNSLVLLFRRRWDEANEKLFLKLSETLLNGRDDLIRTQNYPPDFLS